MVGIVGRALTAHKVVAVRKHITGLRHSRSAPVIAYIDGLQIETASEHVSHIGHLGRVEMAHIKACQASTVHEHRGHIGQLGRVETAQIKAC